MRCVDDQLCPFGEISPPRDSTPQLSVLMAKNVLLDFVLILSEVRGPSEFFDGLQRLPLFVLGSGHVVETRCGWVYH